MNIAYLIYYFTVCCASLLSIYRFKMLDAASKVFSILICFSFITELTTNYAAKKYQNNESIYAIYELLDFGLTCLYFNYSIDVFRRKNIGIYIGAVGIFLGIINILFIQHISSQNSFFLLFEGIMVIGMSLFAFSRLLLNDESLHLYSYPHFWILSILTFSSSITFLNWGLYDYFVITLKNKIWIIDIFLLIVNIISYIGFSLVFLFYPKLKHGND